MSYVTWKLVREAYAPISATWGAPTTLVSFYDPECTASMGNARSSFKVKLTNINGAYDNYFNPNDRITISRALNTSSIASSDQIMIGTANDVSLETSGVKSLVTLGGNSFSDVLLGALTYGDVRTLTIPNAIKYLVNQINTLNNGLYTIDTSSLVATTKSNGSAFPTVNEQWNYRSAKEFIEKYSTQQATGDGDYYYYIDSTNRLAWGKKTTTVKYSFNSATDVYIKATTKRDLKGVRNWFIVKGGSDPDGSPIQIFYRDLSSIAKYGVKPYIIASIANNAETLVKKDKDLYGVTNMNSVSYPMTQGNSFDGTNYGSYASYVVGLRTYVKQQSQIEAQKMSNAYSKGSIVLDIDVRPGQLGWNVADLISCTIPSLGAMAKSMRVNQITYRTDTDTYSLIEDTGSI